MAYMFSGASNFNVDISDWDVSNVISMTWMFSGASNFNVDISDWDVSRVNSMARMFQYATDFTQKLEWLDKIDPDVDLLFIFFDSHGCLTKPGEDCPTSAVFSVCSDDCGGVGAQVADALGSQGEASIVGGSSCQGPCPTGSTRRMLDEGSSGQLSIINIISFALDETQMQNTLEDIFDVVVLLEQPPSTLDPTIPLVPSGSPSELPSQSLSESHSGPSSGPVSYTHLTLPTKA